MLLVGRVGECEELMEEEVKELETLRIELFGNNIRYEGGDDDVLIMGEDINAQRLSDAIAEMQLQLKDLWKIKKVGVFLQRTFGQGPLIMSFGRALKQIFYANP
ncbi:unnamed protein product [Nippostrongylus brasiliensis]|uniref:Reverse transcriptase domain-containing protein n=1 Tax=Nippostrongylus brasiliensis TaxID=27835 RepID=A0A0N4XWT5_NIPBR|nr:unnamed protein product [Nippostrongylus brasiliensis]